MWEGVLGEECVGGRCAYKEESRSIQEASW